MIETIILASVAVIALNVAIGATVFGFFFVRDLIKENWK